MEDMSSGNTWLSHLVHYLSAILKIEFSFYNHRLACQCYNVANFTVYRYDAEEMEDMGDEVEEDIYQPSN